VRSLFIMLLGRSTDHLDFFEEIMERRLRIRKVENLEYDFKWIEDVDAWVLEIRIRFEIER
jgi:hypothetical protein